MSTKYSIVFDDYTSRYFIKSFKKKYSEKVWQFTETAIRNLCINFAELILLEQCDEINKKENLVLCKLDFAIAGTSKSPKKSGCRAILVVDTEKTKIRVLLVYHKNDLPGNNNETVAWQKIIKSAFPEYADLLNRI